MINLYPNLYMNLDVFNYNKINNNYNKNMKKQK